MDVHEVLAALERERPAFHRDGAGRDASWPVSPGLLELLATEAGPGSTTLETGAGWSTVVLVATGAKHTSISPVEHEPQRIEDWCAVHEVATDRWRHLLGGSADVLPRVEIQPLDLLLIDGAHAFPLPAIDWYYGTRHLREGGLVIVDDLQLWPCRIVADFLDGDDGWERTVAGDRFAVFRTLAPGSELTSRWWGQQPYVIERGDGLGPLVRAVRAVRRRARIRNRLRLDRR